MSAALELKRVVVPNAGHPRHHHRKLTVVDSIIFHRIHVGKPETDNSESIAAWFKDWGSEYIGAIHMPYHFIIPQTQPIKGCYAEQAVPLSIRAPHASKWNRRSVGVGVVGDFRHKAPSPKQKKACILLAQRIFDMLEMAQDFRHPRLRKEILVIGHGGLASATKDPAKLVGGKEECPGKLFVPTLRETKKALRDSGRLVI